MYVCIHMYECTPITTRRASSSSSFFFFRALGLVVSLSFLHSHLEWHSLCLNRDIHQLPTPLRLRVIYLYIYMTNRFLSFSPSSSLPFHFVAAFSIELTHPRTRWVAAATCSLQFHVTVSLSLRLLQLSLHPAAFFRFFIYRTHARISYTYSTATIVKWLLLLSLSISPFSVPFLRRLPSLLPAPSFSTPCVEHSSILPFPSPSPPLSRPPTPPPLPHLACSACRALHVVAVVVVLIFFSFFFFRVCLSPVPKPLLAYFEALPVTACAPLRRCLSCPSPVLNSSLPSSLP